MATYKVRYQASTRTAFVLPVGDSNPSNTADYGTFDHDDDPEDELGHEVNHVMFHHVKSLLAAEGVHDLQHLTIEVVASGVSLEPDTLEIAEDDDPVQLYPVITPANALDKQVTYASSDPTKATVDAQGVVTPVAAGTTTITVTHTLTGKTDTTAVTVVEAEAEEE